MISAFGIGMVVGILLGLIFGPAKERLDAAHISGWIDGYRAKASQSLLDSGA